MVFSRRAEGSGHSPLRSSPHTSVNGENVFPPEDSEDRSQKQTRRKAPKCYALPSQQYAVVVKEPRDQSTVLTYGSYFFKISFFHERKEQGNSTML